MADFTPLRTGQFVVRHLPGGHRRTVVVVAAVACLLLLYLVFEFGRWRAGYDVIEQTRERSEMTARITELEQQGAALRAQVATAELARDVDHKAYSEVEQTLADLQAQISKQREELAFYRGIVSPEDGVGALRVQRFEIQRGNSIRHFRLRLVLMQSMNQERPISGTVLVRIEGTQGEEVRQLALNEVGGETRRDGRVAFQLRYFQNLEHDIELPEGFYPRAVTVEVQAARQEPVTATYPWQVQDEG